MAIRLPSDGRALHVTIFAWPAGVATPAAHVARLLVLKPKHSGFFDTTLDTLLDALGIRRVILTGIAGNICVLFTANDAYMRELKLFAPADCIVSNTPAENDHALRQIQTVLKGNVAQSTRLRFIGRARPEEPHTRTPRRIHENRAGQVLRPHR